MQDAAFLVALMAAARTANAQTITIGASAGSGHRVPVATHDIARGTILSAGDIAWSDSSSTSWGSAGRAALAVEPGWVARRAFRGGEPLSEPGVSRPDLVSSGDMVDVVYSNGSVTIKLRGTAVGSGGMGDHVYVRLENRRRLHGTVAGANTVRVM